MAQITYFPTAPLDLYQELDAAVQESIASCPSVEAEIRSRANDIWMAINDAASSSNEEDGLIGGSALFSLKTAMRNILPAVLRERRFALILEQSVHPLSN